MAGELWNRVNIPFPSAVSTVRIHFTSATDVNVKTLLTDNEKTLRLLRSEILQTEVRVLYELLYILNNSFRGIKTFKGLKQVEQCINRLKSMKLDVALQDLTELCPNRLKRGVSRKTGECDVPSQPLLEWLCLKVLGGAQLMSCTLSRCSRAFIFSRQQIKWHEFVVLNVVITSMLSRLWVICRGILVSLSALYQKILRLLSEVAESQPMPFLKDFSLPADIIQFLGPSDALLLTKKLAHIAHAKDDKEMRPRKKKPPVKIKSQGQMRKIKQDLGVAVERDIALEADLKPFLKVFKDFTKEKSISLETHKADGRQKLKKQLGRATTFTDMATQLEKMIQWCKSEKMKKEKRLLTFLRLKCQKMRSLEAAGFNVQRKLQTFKQESRWALCPQRSAPSTCRSSTAVRGNSHLRTRFHSLRSRFKALAVRAGVKKKQLKRRGRKTESSVSGLSGSRQEARNRTTHKKTHKTTLETTGSDDIDDIFASIGL